MGPSIDAKKLRDYVAETNSYTLYEHDGLVELRFSPEFPEAMGHLPEGQSVEHIMLGKEENGRISFYRFITRSAFGETSSEMSDEDDPIMEWLKYI
ncbi:hypothetical protein OXIME_000167 [Oxyplasma meridianum]|uniref:Uncharacterized protein n=1 Tax=Oxyplasma meridianum TaxID=3073602 RepID=A0AAX4NF98_9ARCH